MFRRRKGKLYILLVLLSSVSLAGLTMHALKVSADDPAPDVTITVMPANPSNSTAAGFEFTTTVHNGGSYDNYLCTLDSTPGSCGTPYMVRGLSQGTHTFVVDQYNDQGQSDPSPPSYTWTVDSTTPSPIHDCNELQAIGASTTALTGNYQLANDIDCTNITNFAPIGIPPANGYGNGGFYGDFDGGQHIIWNLNIDNTGSSYTGLFGYNWGHIHHVGISGGLVHGNNYVGGLVGQNSGNIDHSFTDITVHGDGEKVGGFMGLNTSYTVSNDYALGDVSGGDADVGGFVGRNIGRIKDSYTGDGIVTGTGNDIGGFMGDDDLGTGSDYLQNIFSLSNVSGSNAGGLVGFSMTSIVNGHFDSTISGLTCAEPDSWVGNDPGDCTDHPGNRAYFEDLSNEPFVSFTGGTSGYQDNSDIDQVPTFSWHNLAVTPPDTFITTHPSDPSSLSVADFEFESNVQLATFECSFDGGSYHVCTSPYSKGSLASGSHSFSVRAIDGSNQTDASPATYDWVIGSLPPPTPVTSCDDLDSIVMTHITLNRNYILSNDLDCTGYDYYPVGDSTAPFGGTFDGNGYTISNISVNSGASEKGIFGSANGATIKSLHLNNITANGGGGLIANATDVSLQDVYAENVTASGGLIGNAQVGLNSIERSFASGTMNGYNSGGLVGRSDGGTLIIVDSYANSDIAGVNIGGLVGYGSDITIDSSYANTTLHSAGQLSGGLVGGGTPTITDSFAIATLSGGSYATGGLAPSIGAVDNSNYYATSDSGNVNCDQYGTLSGCTEVNGPDYFLGPEEPAPTNAWDKTVWNLHEDGELPTFVVGVAECDLPNQPSTSMHFRCEFQREMKHHYTGNQVVGEYRYLQLSPLGSWVYGDMDEDGNINIANLTPNTVYVIQTHAIWDIGASDWLANGTVQITAPGPDFDFDHDGIPDLIENAGPNNGDANGDLYDDGVTISGLDRDQANVTSLVNSKTGKFSVLQTDCNQNQNVSVSSEPTDHKDVAYDYGLGLINFTATGCSSKATVTEYFYGTYDSGTFTARKYNSVTHSYTTIPGAIFSTVTIGGQKALKLVYTITDNGPLDQDPTVGTITDPSGPGIVTIGVPNTGFGQN